MIHTPRHQALATAGAAPVPASDAWSGRLARAWSRAEGPTWLVIAAVYGGWLAVLGATAWMPLWAALPVMVVLVTWHGHLQHELLHGHPTRNPWINALLGLPPLGLFYPYSVFKRNHLGHHDAESLTKPGADLESFYVMPGDWARYGAVRRAVLVANNTMLGRFLLGPALSLPPFLLAQSRRLIAGEPLAWGEWALHAGLAGGLLYAIQAVGGVEPWLYLLAVAYPGHGLLMVRSYLEHRPSANADERTAVVEGGWFWTLLYLANNFHVVHHEHPGLAWFKIPAAYAANREAIAGRNGGYVFKGYGEVARRYLIRPKDSPVFPM